MRRLFRRSKAANSAFSGEIPPKFKLIQAFTVVLVAYKNEEEPMKNKYISIWDFCFQTLKDS